jgi:hypothetical protein
MKFKLPKFNLNFWKKKEEPKESTPYTEETLPEDLEKFRMEREEMRRESMPQSVAEPTPTREELFPKTPDMPAEPIGEAPFPTVETTPRIEVRPEPKPEVTMPKEDLILQKLDTIDTRLKLIEEKMK